MTLSRPLLPHETNRLFLTDAGLETDMIFNRGLDLPAFASHTLFARSDGRDALSDYFRGFLELACEHGAGFVLDTATWRAQREFADTLATTPDALRRANHHAVSFARELQVYYTCEDTPIVINGVIGPCGDGYAPERWLTSAEAETYHGEQIRWLADAGVDMLSAVTFTNVSEAIGAVRAAQRVGLPIAVSFTVETDGHLPDGCSLQDAIDTVDAKTGAAPAYYMVNCAHPTHFVSKLAGGDWLERIRGFRCNASRKSHAELDESETIDCEAPEALADDCMQLIERVPHANVFGGCCGSDLRHIHAIASHLAKARHKVVA